MIDKHEVRTGFHEELKNIRRDVLSLTNCVIKIIPKINQAFLDKDTEKAQMLIDSDKPSDMDSLALDKRCYHALALQQPMAKDLRQIISAISINNDIKRSGDLAVNVAKTTFRFPNITIPQELKEIITQMSKEAQKLLKDSMVAYVEEDAKLANELGKADDVLDELNFDCMKAALNANIVGNIDLQAVIQIVLMARYYERIGDHAVNIGERIGYMVTGKINK